MWSRTTQCPTLRFVISTKQRPSSALQTYSTRTAAIPLHQLYSIPSQDKKQTLRVNISQIPHLIGVRSTRGIREYNEDRYKVRVLRFPEQPETQLVCCAMYDGHAGARCADFLSARLHRYFETVQAEDVLKVLGWLQSQGEGWSGYVPRALRKLTKAVMFKDENLDHWSYRLDTVERLSMAYLQADRTISASPLGKCGSTGTSVVLDALDQRPFWSSQRLRITTANVGDTRAILCDTVQGKAKRLTYEHHPTDPAELKRIKKHGAYVDKDAFGEFMALGQAANTRAFGDRQLKSFGVIAEPSITDVVYDARDLAFLVIVSDGVTAVLSDQEIVELVKYHDHPTQAAVDLVDAAEKLGTSDNVTAMVVGLPGWTPHMVTSHSDTTSSLPTGHDQGLDRLIGVQTEVTSTPQDIDAGMTKRRGSWLSSPSTDHVSREKTSRSQSNRYPTLSLNDVLVKVYRMSPLGTNSDTPQTTRLRAVVPPDTSLPLDTIHRRLAGLHIQLQMTTGISASSATFDSKRQKPSTTHTQGLDLASNSKILQLSCAMLGHSPENVQDTSVQLTPEELLYAWQLLGVEAQIIQEGR
ncbi:Protein phosphatase 2C 6 [Dispira parvispora]|uniref:Protein phosphatase 2C 6 n=1 Tax=Dispira parvispora TaxID=1520584 RepID=A0A9W8ANZ2_9FUNG|nr:Protein phosphatase 2C 6 [Dispira parvispora]